MLQTWSMALFQKKPQTSNSAPLYTLGLQKTILIVGLGNPGKKYDGTRHNLGFACVNAFADKHEFPAWTVKKDLKSLVTSHNLGDTRVILAKPNTFMNNSGEAVQAVQQFYKIPNKQIVIVYDELDLPYGQIRTREGGSSAGHNGIKSLLQHVEGDIQRIRIGIKNEVPKTDSAAFVLKKFSKDETKHLPTLLKEVESILVEYVYSGQLAPETRKFIV